MSCCRIVTSETALLCVKSSYIFINLDHAEDRIHMNHWPKLRLEVSRTTKSTIWNKLIKSLFSEFQLLYHEYFSEYLYIESITPNIRKQNLIVEQITSITASTFSSITIFWVHLLRYSAPVIITTLLYRMFSEM